MAEEDPGGMLGNLLQNPAMLSGILSLFGGLSDAEADDGATYGQSDAQKRRALLLALRPYLGEQRGHALTQMLQLLQVIDSLQNIPAFLGEEKGEDTDGTE